MTTVASNVVPPPVAPVAPEMKVVVVEQEVKVKVTAAGDAVTDAAVVVEKGEEQMREQEEKDEATVTDLEKLEREKDEETETETERADDRKIEEKIEVKAEQKRRRRQGLEMPVATTAGEACLHLLFSDFEGRLGAVRRSHKRFRKAALEEKKSMVGLVFSTFFFPLFGVTDSFFHFEI